MRLIVATILFAGLLLGCSQDAPLLTSDHRGSNTPLPPSTDIVKPFTAAEKEVLAQYLDLNEADYNFKRFITLPDHLIKATRRSHGRINLPEPDLTKALLGRVLFYDTQLSKTEEVSCASCHRQELAFSDDQSFSKGIKGQLTVRNSIALGSVPAFVGEVSGYGTTVVNNDGTFETLLGSVGLLWDERAATISEQSKLSIGDDIEMGHDLSALSTTLNKQEMYRILTRKAYGDEELTPDRITLALEKFCNTLSSVDSPFDDLMDVREANKPTTVPLTERFSSAELHGLQIYISNCSQCHTRNMTQPFVKVANNGLDLEYSDKGVGNLRGAGMNGIFKVPILRNVALTAPYMHDGRFQTLREVIDHYSEGIQDHPNLDRRLREHTGQPMKMNFNEKEKQALEAFLQLTTDRSLMYDERVSDPFKQ